MQSPIRRAPASRQFVGSEENLQRLARIGWAWRTDVVDQIKKNKGIPEGSALPRPPKILPNQDYEAYERSLGQWFLPGETAEQPLGSGAKDFGSRSHLSGSFYRPLGSGARPLGMGYHPDLPDWRDFDFTDKTRLQEPVTTILQKIEARNAVPPPGKGEKQPPDASARSYLLSSNPELPEFQDLRYTGYFSPVENQGALGSCTAQAVIGLVEYLQMAGGGTWDDMSRLFNYKTSRRLLGWTGDTGSYLRTAIKALVLFGAPPEAEWPYLIEQYEDEPEAYHYAYGQNFKASAYIRLDHKRETKANVLNLLKRTLLDGFPVVFGFSVYDSIDEVCLENKFVIPFPGRYDTLEGGHAVVAVGYDDTHLERPSFEGGSCGAIIIRNSWGSEWGEAGYAYLPEDYISQGLAHDFWTIFNHDWLKSEWFE